MRSQFIEKRRQLREPIEQGEALIDGRHLRILNWSQNGFLLEVPEPRSERGDRLSAEIDLMTGTQHFAFAAELRVVRVNGERRLMAVSYVCLDAPVARRIDAHFQPPTAPRPRFIADGSAAGAGHPPGMSGGEEKKPETPAAVKSGGETVSALREIAALKTAFARKFHPDTAPRDGSYLLRVEMFKDFWSVLEAAEARLKTEVPGKS